MTRRVTFALIALLCARPAAALADEVGDCERGLAQYRAGELTRAFVLLEDCTSDAAKAAFEKVEQQLGEGDYAPVSVIVNPEGARVTISTLGDEVFIAPRLVWVEQGKHIVRASMDGYEDFTVELVITSRARRPLLLSLKAVGGKEKSGTKTATVDFGDEPGAAVGEHVVSVDPNIEHETLLPKRYRGGGVGDTIDGGEGRLSIGIKAGMTVASVTGASPDVGSRIGAAVGAFATYSLGSAFALQPELYYAQKGAEGTALDYIVVPALAVVGVKVHAKVRLYAVAGPAIAVSLTSEVNAQDITTFDLGLVAGLGVLLPVVGRGIRLECRYELGLNAVDGEDARNRVFSLTAGYAF